MQRGRQGFTLVEILVVLTIVALMVGGALLALGLVGGTDSAARDAERLQSLLLAARERAELENRDYGIRLRADGYEFLAFDAASGRWLASDDRLLARHRWSAPLQVELDVDGRRVSLARRDEAARRDGGTRPSVDDRRNLDAPVPDFGVDASGEFTNFEVRLQTDARGSTWRLRIDSSGDLGVEELVRK